MQLVLLAMFGGAIGSGASYLVNVGCAQWFGAAFPWATFTVNVLGAFLMGMVVAGAVPLLGGSAEWRTFLGTGILGGFTTFSAFSADIWQLIERQQAALAVVYIVGSVALSLAALLAGMATVKASLK